MQRLDTAGASTSATSTKNRSTRAQFNQQSLKL
jgi:hypothetical protein